MLNNCDPNPGSSEKCHHTDVRVPSSLVQCEPLPVEEATEKDVGRDLRQCRNQRRQRTGADAEVKGQERASIGEQKGRVKEEGYTSLTCQ